MINILKGTNRYLYILPRNLIGKTTIEEKAGEFEESSACNLNSFRGNFSSFLSVIFDGLIFVKEEFGFTTKDIRHQFVKKNRPN